MYNKVCKKCLNAFWNDCNNVLQQQQSGLRPAYSTVTDVNCCCVCHYIINSLNKKRHCAALFVDLSKVFGSVDLTFLLNKLYRVGFEVSVKSHLCGWVQTVVADGFISSPQMVDKGVPQGSILGSLLFTLLMKNIYFPTHHCNTHFSEFRVCFQCHCKPGILQFKVWFQWPTDLFNLMCNV